MTISNNYAPTSASGDGVTSVFTGGWPIFVASNLLIEFVNKTTGARTTQNQGTNYILTFNSGGWVATFQSGFIPPATVNVVGSRVIPFLQGQPYSTSGGFNGFNTEQSFDLLTAMLQDLQDGTDRSLVVPVGDIALNPLPDAIQRASSYLGFDPSGQPIAITGAVGTVPVSPAMATVIDEPTLTAGFAALGVGINGLPYQGSPSPSNDALSIYNAGDAAVEKIALQDIFKTVIPQFASKTTPVNADIFQLLDSAASNAPKQISYQNLKAGIASGISGGEVVLLGQASASNNASLNFTGLISSAYDYYFFLYKDILPATTTALILMRYSTNNGSSYVSTSGTYLGQNIPRVMGATTATPALINGTALPLNSTSGAGNAFCGRLDLLNPASVQSVPSANWKNANPQGSIIDEGYMQILSGASPINAVQFLASTGNITSGTIEMYGVKNT